MQTATNRITDLETPMPPANGNGKKTRAKQPGRLEVTIQPMNFRMAEFTITGTSAYVQNKFSAKAKEQIRLTQEAGQSGKNRGKKREAKNFKARFDECQHRFSKGGDRGIPASAFRSAMIDACRVAGMAMTMAKMTVFVEQDGQDYEDGTPLVKITKGTPEYLESAVRNDNGSVDLRARAMWKPGWQAKLRVRYDAEQFTAEDVSNLLERAGQQVGVGEGRAFSRDSHGMGWGFFTIAKK